MEALEIFQNVIDKKVPGWHTKIVGGKNFDDLLQVDGVALWWFYRRFVTSHVLPSSFDVHRLLEKKEISLYSKMYYSFVSLMFRKYFYYNEKIKRIIVQKRSVAGDKVLFLSYVNHRRRRGEVYRIQKMVDRLQKDGKIKPFVLFTDPLSFRSYSMLRNLDHSVYQYVDGQVELEAGKIAVALFKKWKEVDKNNLFGPYWDRFRFCLNFFFSEEFIYNTVLYYLTFRKILMEEKVKVVVLTSRNSFFEKCIIAAAHHVNIPLVVVQHGMGLATVNPEVFPGMKFAVFGDFYKQRLLKWGVDKNDVIVTGPVIFDDIVSYLGMGSSEETILIITETFVEESYIFKEEYFRFMEKVLLEVCILAKPVVIKLHPRERHKKAYEEVIQRNSLSNVTVIDTQGPEVLYQLIQKSAMVVNFFSTVALEAMILGKPIVTIDLGPPLISSIDETIFSGGPVIKITDDIQGTVLAVMNNREKWKEKGKEILRHFCYTIDGKAYERTVRLIYEMAGV